LNLSSGTLPTDEPEQWDSAYWWTWAAGLCLLMNLSSGTLPTDEPEQWDSAYLWFWVVGLCLLMNLSSGTLPTWWNWADGLCQSVKPTMRIILPTCWTSAVGFHGSTSMTGMLPLPESQLVQQSRYKHNHHRTFKPHTTRDNLSMQLFFQPQIGTFWQSGTHAEPICLRKGE
jgi:hypothetical protein